MQTLVILVNHEDSGRKSSGFGVGANQAREMCPRHVPVSGQEMNSSVRRRLPSINDKPRGVLVTLVQTASRHARFEVDGQDIESILARKAKECPVMLPVKSPPMIEGDGFTECRKPHAAGQISIDQGLVGRVKHFEGQRGGTLIPREEPAQETDQQALGGRKGVVVTGEDHVGLSQCLLEIGHRTGCPDAPEIGLIGLPVALQFDRHEADNIPKVVLPPGDQVPMQPGDPLAGPVHAASTEGGFRVSRHAYHFVRNREFWTLYWTMIMGALFWGGFWSVLAWRFLHFNQQALLFLASISITSSLCLGFTLYFRLRVVIEEAARRLVDRDLDLEA